VTYWLRTFGSCKESQHFRPDSSKKQTQPNPLRLSIIDSARYITFEKTKPIDIKWPICSNLKRKKAGFSKNMDQTVGSLFPISQKRTQQGLWPVPSDQWRVARTTMQTITNEAGMLLKNNKMLSMVTCPIPDWFENRNESRNSRNETGMSFRMRSWIARVQSLFPIGGG